MKKIFLCVLTFFSFFVFTSTEGYSAQLEGSRPINEVFPDSIFANYIASQLKKGVDQEVTQNDLNKIQTVNITGTQMSSIQGLQYLNYAYDFRLSSNQITDLTPFSTWEHLGSYRGWTVWHISLSENPITDLTPLANLKISILDFYIHRLPIDNSQINNLVMIDQNWDISRYTFGTNHIDDFSKLKGTFIERLSGYNNISNKNHTINLGEQIVVDDEPLVVANPSLWFDGTTIAVSTASNAGVSSADNKLVTWHDLQDTKPAAVSFTVAGPNTTVTYNLSIKYVTTSSVIVNYVDEQGEKLAEPVTLAGNVGEEYVTESKTFAGYTLKETPANATGIFTEEPQQITYVYRKDPIPAQLTVNYVDEQGEKLAEPVTLAGNVGEEYVTESKIFAGYTLKETPTNATGIFTEEPQQVTYVYTKNQATKGIVIVKYLDLNDQKISDQTQVSGLVGEEYATEAKKIPGYELTEMPANASGIYNKDTIEVVYVYRGILKQEETTDSKRKDTNKNKEVNKSDSSTSSNKNISYHSKEKIESSKKDKKIITNKKLPQTGEKLGLLFSVSGGVIFLIGVFIFLKYKRS